MASESVKVQVEALLVLIGDAAHQAIAEYDKAGKAIPTLDSVEAHPLDVSDDTSGLKKAIRLLEAACEQLCVTLAPPYHTMINRTQNCDGAGILAVIETGVTDALVNHPEGLHVDQLSKIVNVEAGKLARILRLLATRHCFTEVGENIFSNNRLSIMLHSENPIRDIAYIQLTCIPKAVTVLCENLTREPCARSNELRDAPLMQALQFNGGFYDWLAENPKKRSIFQRAMVGLGQVTGSRGVLYEYNWEGCKTLCDLGSGVGNFSMPFSRLHPDIHVSMLDLPGPIAQAKAFWIKEYPSAIEKKRIDFIEGDFFQPISVKNQDIYYVRNCIHNWSDDLAVVILQNIRQAMGAHSRLLIRSLVMRLPFQTTTPSVISTVNPQPTTMKPCNSNLYVLVSALAAFTESTRHLSRCYQTSVSEVCGEYYQDFTMFLTFNTKERTLNEVTDLAYAPIFSSSNVLLTPVHFSVKAGLAIDGVFDIGETCMLQFRAI
ncbi:S-adenosyl-L-methionine-dependent methyltransferase [Mycena rebaudengoi]|nr:S-adenosyl-L-methionine-dependent methyltransferase [Mycena rebaudengoi]